ncbi:MAG: hypothetical protein SFU85_00720 [Candidatus Methylacidiphilales bacterium]|nr:hypothetical protein [Candidatus Methylacidiphilales bacterium]
MKIPPCSTLIGLFFLNGLLFAQSFKISEGLSETDRRRFQRFETFQIKGVCGDADLDRLAGLGVNTVRGYSIKDPEDVRKKLDHAHRLGMKMVVSEWMPHQGENKDKKGGVWSFDYHAKGDQMVSNLVKKVEAIGDHPALLMWGLGNEVHLDEPYLRVANRMSLEIHKRFPHHLTSLTMVNAKPEGIEAVKKFAPDIDVLGIQSYSRGAVYGSIKKTEELWGKPFYMSEFNTNGPWNFGKTPWGVENDEPVTKKVSDLKACYASIDASPLCLGSTIFVWGHALPYRPTYFSLLLDPDPNGQGDKESFDHLMMTPQADVMTEHFTGRPPKGNRAPVLSKLEFEGGTNYRFANPGEPMNVTFSAQDPDGDTITFVTWILDSTERRTTRVAGPFPQASPGHAVIPAPSVNGEYLLMVYAIDQKGGASASTIAFKVPTPVVETPVPAPTVPTPMPVVPTVKP